MVERMRATANWVCLHRDVHSKRVTPVNKASKAITIRALNCTGFAGGVFLCVRRRSRALVAQRFPKTNWVCFVAGLLRTHVCPMRHVDRCHPPPTFAFNARRRAEFGQAGASGPLKVNWVCFAKR